jgi:hypothetical protein
MFFKLDHIADCPEGHYVSVRLPDGRSVRVYSDGMVWVVNAGGNEFAHHDFASSGK